MILPDSPPPEINTFLSYDNLYDLKKAATVLRAVNHMLRQLIIKTISEHDRITVTDLYILLRIEQSVLSQQLLILRQAGIVSNPRSGKFMHYTINFKRLEDIGAIAKQLIAK